MNHVSLQWKRISNGRPFVIKGIQSVDDALKAHEVGCEGIVVTNHAGRQVDGAVGSLEVLPDIVDAVGDSELSFMSSSCALSNLSTRHRNDDHFRFWYPNRRRRI
jgi:isopentenyl diphosphate isomerase/L-lactate dehydrogenase-like FMN-dependent dehydrogenase